MYKNLLSHANIFQGMSEDEFNYSEIVAKFKEELHFIIEESDIKSEDYDSLENKLITILKDVYEQKMSVAEPKQRRNRKNFISSNFR